MMVHTFNPSIWEAAAGGSQVLGQPELYSETLSQNKGAGTELLFLVMQVQRLRYPKYCQAELRSLIHSY